MKKQLQTSHDTVPLRGCSLLYIEFFHQPTIKGGKVNTNLHEIFKTYSSFKITFQPNYDNIFKIEL